jgi:hypothetical protein
VVEYQEMLSRVDWEDFETLTGKDEKVGDWAHVSASRVVFGSGKLETKVGRVREETVVSNTVLALGTLSAVAAGAAWVYRGQLPKRLRLRA